MQSMLRTVVVLGTGGTIAGQAASAGDTTGYTAGQVAISDLVAASGMADRMHVEARQVAQIDSKDLTFDIWQALTTEVVAQLARPEVDGIVITHGTDTLEETAYFLHGVLPAAHKPVVLTCAMRPASAVSADGPGNLMDALRLAAGDLDGADLAPPPHGVLVCVAGDVWAAPGLRKIHTLKNQAFGAGDLPAVARVDGGALRLMTAWPTGGAWADADWHRPAASWPRVEIVSHYAGAEGRMIDLLLTAGVDGLVVAGTGHGTLGAGMQAAVDRATAAGVRVQLASRCAFGPVLGGRPLQTAGELAPPQARVALLLDLLSGR